MTLTKFGFREWGSALIALIVIEIICYFLIRNQWCKTGSVIGGLALIVFFAFAAFFRNPVRTLPADPKLLVSPADGTIRDIEVVEDFNLPPFTGKALRIGIFLSVFNVHVNRTPAKLKVEDKHYREGEYLDARDSGASQRNEAMTISGTAEVEGKKFPLAIRQISGAIARRIVCPVDPGCELERGEVYGMIKFGSRTELYLPAEGFEVSVKIGDPVRGGETVLAVMKAEETK